VLIDGRRANACLALAVAQDGARVTTVEGLADAEDLHPLQAAFIERDAFQCGYCTPGQLCSAAGLLGEPGPSAVTEDLTADPGLTAAEIRERMSGNLCRCGAYVNIVAAIADVAARDVAGDVAAAGGADVAGDVAAAGGGDVAGDDAAAGGAGR
jgi:xanthine dehydrogenase YagT iron-sulfur-binding subunit